MGEQKFENHFLTILVPNISEELAEKIIAAARAAAGNTEVAAYYKDLREY